MNKQDVLKTQSCVLRVNIHCDGCKSKIKKILQKIDGVYTMSIDAEQGKVTVNGSVDPNILIKKLEKHGKHAELWGPSSKGSSQNNQFINLNNQFKNFQFDEGKMGKDSNNNKKGGNGNGNGNGKDQPKGGQQQPKELFQQMLQQQMGGTKDLKMPSNKKQKSVKFNIPDDDYDDEFDDDYDDEFDDDELDDDMHEDYGHGHELPTSKNIPIMGGKRNGHGGGDKKAKGNGGGGDKKGKEGVNTGAKKGGGGGGGGGMAGFIKGILGGGKSDGKKGNDGKKDCKHDGKYKGGGGGGGEGHQHQNGGKNVGLGKGKTGGEGKNGKKGGSNNGGQNGKNNGNGNINMEGKKEKSGGGGGELDVMNQGKNGGPNMSMMGHMGSYPMGQMGSVAAFLPAGSAVPHMINPTGYYEGGMGPYNINPQQQHHMAMMMNPQRMDGADGYGGMYHPQPNPMMYGRPPMGAAYGPPMVPPPAYHDPFTSYLSDENTNSCSIM